MTIHFRPEEFVEAFAKEQSSLEAPSKKTRNLEIYVDWFNRLSYLVCTDVIKVNGYKIKFRNSRKNFIRYFQHSKKKQRARVIEFWVNFFSSRLIYQLYFFILNRLRQQERHLTLEILTA